MRGYAKINGNSSFSQNSKFRKEYPFLDVDFDDTLDAYSSKPQENEQKPSIIKDDRNKKNGFFVENSEEHVDEEAKKGERNVDGVLRRNYTISSSSKSLAYQKNGKSENLERQSSTKAIQKAVKRAFSTRRSCSVNSSRYCRIYDQPKNVRDFDYNSNDDYNNADVYDYGNNERLKQQHHRRHDQEDYVEYEIESNGSMEMSNNNPNGNGRVKVGSKVAKACKRLFNR